MKRFYTMVSLLLICTVMVYGQTRKQRRTAFPYVNVHANEVTFDNQNPVLTNNPPSILRIGAASYGDVVGMTAYDYHSNSSIDSKIRVEANGNISVVWTKGPVSDPGGADRRIGYNYYDAGTQTWGTEESIGDIRRGWPTIPNHTGAGDLLMSHQTTGAPLQTHTRPTAGDAGTAWTNTALDGVSANMTLFPASAASGDTIHFIYNGAPNGVADGFWYSRSPDGGTTWDLVDVILPAMDPAEFIAGGNQSADTYVMDARGDNVAIVCGGWDEHIHLWKSTDRGDSWTHNRIFKFDTADGYAQFDGTTGDYFHFTTGMDHAVAIDANGMVHFAAGMVGTNSPAGQIGGSGSYFPFNPGLIYWNESMGFDQSLIQGDTAANEDFVLLTYVDEDGNGENTTTFDFDSVSRVSNAGVITNPGVSIADNGTVVLTWNAPKEDAVLQGIFLAASNHDGIQRLHRDLYAIASFDGGTTWQPEGINLANDVAGVGLGFGTPVENETHNFAFQRIGSDQNVHLFYMSGATGGGEIINSSTVFTDNEMVHYKFPYSALTGLADPRDVRENVNMSMYPNPANSHVDIMLALGSKAGYDLVVTNLLGQVVESRALNLDSGSNLVSLDVNSFSTGVYLVTIKSERGSITQKLVVE